MLLELLGEARVDPGGDEAVGLARRGILDRADDPALGDRQLVDLAALEELPELAVGQDTRPAAPAWKTACTSRIASTAIITYQALKLLFLSIAGPLHPAQRQVCARRGDLQAAPARPGGALSGAAGAPPRCGRSAQRARPAAPDEQEIIATPPRIALKVSQKPICAIRITQDQEITQRHRRLPRCARACRDGDGRLGRRASARPGAAARRCRSARRLRSATAALAPPRRRLGLLPARASRSGRSRRSGISSSSASSASCRSARSSSSSASASRSRSIGSFWASADQSLSARENRGTLGGERAQLNRRRLQRLAAAWRSAVSQTSRSSAEGRASEAEAVGMSSSRGSHHHLRAVSAAARAAAHRLAGDRRRVRAAVPGAGGRGAGVARGRRSARAAVPRLPRRLDQGARDHRRCQRDGRGRAGRAGQAGPRRPAGARAPHDRAGRGRGVHLRADRLHPRDVARRGPPGRSPGRARAARARSRSRC